MVVLIVIIIAKLISYLNRHLIHPLHKHKSAMQNLHSVSQNIKTASQNVHIPIQILVVETAFSCYVIVADALIQ